MKFINLVRNKETKLSPFILHPPFFKMTDNTTILDDANEPLIRNPYMEAAYADQSNARLLVLAMHYQHLIHKVKVSVNPIDIMEIYFADVFAIITDSNAKEIEKDAALMTLIESIDKSMSFFAFGMAIARNKSRIERELKKEL